MPNLSFIPKLTTATFSLQDNVLWLTHKSLKTSHTSYHLSILSITTHSSTCSLCLNPSYVTFDLKIANRSFYHFATILWNIFPLTYSSHHFFFSFFWLSYPWPLYLSFSSNSHLFHIFCPSSAFTWATLGWISLILTLLLGLSFHLIATLYPLNFLHLIHPCDIQLV